MFGRALLNSPVGVLLGVRWGEALEEAASCPPQSGGRRVLLFPGVTVEGQERLYGAASLQGKARVDGHERSFRRGRAANLLPSPPKITPNLIET